MNRRWIKYAAALLIGGAAACALLFGRGFLAAETMRERMRLLSDAFLVPGALLLLAGCLLWIVREGTFAGMGYTFRKLWNSLHSQEYQAAHKESYAEYRARKSAQKTPFLFLLVPGGVFLLPAVLFTILYLLA